MIIVKDHVFTCRYYSTYVWHYNHFVYKRHMLHVEISCVPYVWLHLHPVFQWRYKCMTVYMKYIGGS